MQVGVASTAWLSWVRLALAMMSVPALLLTGAAQAQLTIEITKGVQGALPLAVLPFSGDQRGAGLAKIVREDLRRSGRFEPLNATEPYAGDDSLAVWRQRGADHVISGVVQAQGEQRQVQFELIEVFQGRRLLGLEFTVRRQEMRRLGHRIADLIYQQLTGERGAFNTRIAYVTASGVGEQQRYALVVADADGFAPQPVLRSPQPLLSPAWSPDGRRLAYVTFEKRRAQIYSQDLLSSRRQLLSADPGINSAPAWSPDGQQLALTLSRDGNPEIYVKNLASDTLTRITRNAAIDTEPAWSPDGRSLVFTSDRSGGPQLYQVPAAGGRATRLSFEGAYNADASFSPDGRQLALVHRKRGKFYIAVMDRRGGNLRLLTDGGLDESPSFAPNGRMIIYATSSGGRGVLAAVSVDGRIKQRLRPGSGDVREPSWSPYSR